MTVTITKQEDGKRKLSYGEGLIKQAYYDLDEEACVNLMWTIINADKLGILAKPK